MTANLQKRLLIGALVILVVALLGFFIGLPNEILYHSRKYFWSLTGVSIIVTTLGALTILLAILGINRESNKPVQRIPSLLDTTKPVSTLLIVEGGAYGGLIGGVVAGIVIGFAYYFTFRTHVTPIIISQLLIFAAFTGVCAGASARFGSMLFRERVPIIEGAPVSSSTGKPNIREVLGSVLCTTLAGIPVGVLGALVFSTQTIPWGDEVLIGVIAAAVLGALGTAIIPLFYDFTGSTKRMIQKIPISIMIGVVSGMLIILALYVTTLLNFVNEVFYSQDIPPRFPAGGILGSSLGIMVGLIIGSSLFLYRRSGQPKDRDDPQDAPRRMRYEDFTLKIEPVDANTYRVEVQGPTGEAESLFQLPFDLNDLNSVMKTDEIGRGQITRGREPRVIRSTQEYGQKLYDSVLTGTIRDRFSTARHQMESSDCGLRFVLRLSASPNLAGLPWELMHDGREFLTLSDETPVVRYLDQPRPIHPMKVKPPLRILVTISAPHDQLPLNVEAETERMTEALKTLTQSGAVEIEYTQEATTDELQCKLREAKAAGTCYHVWHFIGHGKFDDQSQSSKLIFVDENGNSKPVGENRLGVLFNDHPELRLAVLNACEGARRGQTDLFGGVAGTLVEQEVPAVIGMQFPITDQAAISFTKHFYQSLVIGMPVEAALVQGRKAIFVGLGDWVQWAAPVLFMRYSDGYLFDWFTAD